MKNANILIVGDIVNTKNKEGFIDTDLQKLIKCQDYAVCNFEAPVQSSGLKYPKVGPSIFQNIETMEILKKAGFDLLLLANNHMYDYGETGLLETIKLAETLNFETVGAGKNFETAYKPVIKEINGLNICFINACEAQFGVLDDINIDQASGYAWINHPVIDQLILEYRKKVDKIIICAHAGLEDYSIPLVQWKKRYRVLCDLGADCIVASHPHVPQGYEIYNNKPIFFSLGNFYFDTESFEYTSDHSFSVILNITKEKISFRPVFHHKLNGKVMLTSKEEVTISFETLNPLIENEHEIEKMYKDAYLKITKQMFRSIHNSYYADTVKTYIKKTIFKIFTPSKIKIKKQYLLQHLNRNETYRWVTITAIELLSRQR